MPSAWDDGIVYDPDIAAAMAERPVKNGEIARGQWPVTADILQVSALSGLPPMMGVGCLLDTNAREVRFIAPPFATSARVWIYAAGDDDIDIAVTAGGSGSVTINPALTGTVAPDQAMLFQGSSALTVTAGDSCRALTLEVSRASTDAQCYAIALQWGGFAI